MLWLGVGWGGCEQTVCPKDRTKPLSLTGTDVSQKEGLKKSRAGQSLGTREPGAA